MVYHAKRKPKRTREQVMLAITGDGDRTHGSGGIMTTIAQRLGIDRRTAVKYVDHWASTREALYQEEEAMLDMAEAQLYMLIRSGHPPTVMWYLAMKGARRGYAGKVEHEHEGQITLSWGDGTPVTPPTSLPEESVDKPS